MKSIKDTQAVVQNVNFKIDPVVKGSAEAVLSGMGLNMSAYIGMCLRQLAQDRKIPFSQTIDPDFWVAEARISAAKSLIDCGAWSAVDDFHSKIIKIFEENTSKREVAAFIKASASLEEELPNESGFTRNLNLQAISKIYYSDKCRFDDTSASRTVKSGKEMIDKIENNLLPMCKANSEIQFVNDLKALYESATNDADRIINDLLNNDHIKSALENDPEIYDDQSKLEIIEEIESTVLDVADRDPSSLSMRFVGSGQIDALNAVFAAAQVRKKLKDRIKNADNQIKELENSLREAEEQSRKHMMDMIKAMNQ